MSTVAGDKPAFSKGALVYYRRYAELSLGELAPLNRVFFYVGQVSYNHYKKAWFYKIMTDVWIEESKLRHGDALSLMVEEDED